MIAPAPFIPEAPLNLVPEVTFAVLKPQEPPVEDRHWSGSSSKHRDKEWDSSTYNSLSRSSSKNDDDYNRNSSKYYDKYESRSKERDREYGSKYWNHSHRGEDYERDRYRKDKDRRDYRGKDEYRERDKSRKDRDYYEYKDRSYGYSSKSSTKTESYRMESTEMDYYDSYNSRSSFSYSKQQSYGQSSSSIPWAPPPPEEELKDSPPRPPPEPPNDDDEACDDATGAIPKPPEDGETTVDLDTRIAMLFKSKSFGGDVPSLFSMDDSDSEMKTADDKKGEDSADGRMKQNEIDLKKIKIEDDNDAEDGELVEKVNKSVSDSDDSNVSSAPSPYESRVAFLANRKFYKRRKRRSQVRVKVESGASDISSSEDDLLAKGSYSPPLPKHMKVKDDDQMSLSSLSSTEPIKEESDLKFDMKFDPAASGVYPVAFSSYNAAYYYQNSFHQFQQPGQWMTGADASSYYNQYKKETPANTDDPHEIAVKKVIDKLILELKQILKKDFNKRMIENTAYKKYEAWYDDQERNKTSRRYHETNEPVTSRPPVDISTTSVLESYQPKGGLGILRNIRIQRIKKEPVRQIQEDSRKSDPDDDDMVHGSDSEKEELPAPSKSSFINRNIAVPSSSESSESSDSSSDEDEEEEEKDDHVYSSDTASLISDEELPELSPPPSAKKEKENNRIYSDSDSDELDVPKVSTKIKAKIYSDSEDEEPAPPGTDLKESAVPEVKEEAVKSPEVKVETPVATPAESDSDFFNDDVMSKPPRTPGRVSSDDQVEKEVEKKPPVVVVKQESAKKKPEVADRMYSDSEEEREYQEKIRRNTEYMEMAERQRKEQLNDDKGNSSDTSRTVSASPSPVKQLKTEIKQSSFDEAFQSKSTLPPPTPGANLKLEQSFPSQFDQDTGKKKRGRPKGSTGKQKEPKKTKNGQTSKTETQFAQPSSKEREQMYSLKLSPFSSSDGGSSQASLVALEHCYSLPPSASPSLSSSPQDHQDIHLDHDYCGKSDGAATPLQPIQPNQVDEHQKKETGVRPVGRPRKDPNAPKAQYTKKDKSGAAVEKHKPPKVEKVKKIDYKEHKSMVDNFVPQARYNKRSMEEEFQILCRFFTQGIDQEDVDYIKRAYTYLIQNDTPGTELLHQVHWVDHCATDRFEPPPSKKRRRDDPEVKQHATGCARTEGYYKIDSKDKAHYKYHHLRGTVAGAHLDNTAKMAVAKMQNASREARSNQRRLLTAYGGCTESDLLKFNQLKFRNKQLKFAKSAIHDWGLFAMEPIAADEMVIEYVGQMVRPSVADWRESKYEAIGIGSSYLFRIDLETIIDATKCGNLARFINHSCNVSFSILFSNY